LSRTASIGDRSGFSSTRAIEHAAGLDAPFWNVAPASTIDALPAQLA
jgi:hypothetical protein